MSKGVWYQDHCSGQSDSVKWVLAYDVQNPQRSVMAGLDRLLGTTLLLSHMRNLRSREDKILIEFRVVEPEKESRSFKFWVRVVALLQCGLKYNIL